MKEKIITWGYGILLFAVILVGPSIAEKLDLATGVLAVSGIYAVLMVGARLVNKYCK